MDLDRCHLLLHLLGWSPGETGWRNHDGLVLAWGDTQTQAWWLALRMAGRVQQHVP